MAIVHLFAIKSVNPCDQFRQKPISEHGRRNEGNRLNKKEYYLLVKFLFVLI